jgi:hypothetical protein
MKKADKIFSNIILIVVATHFLLILSIAMVHIINGISSEFWWKFFALIFTGLITGIALITPLLRAILRKGIW